MARLLRLLALPLLLLLSACLFKSPEAVIGPDEAVSVPIKTGYLYTVDPKDGAVSAIKFIPAANEKNAYLFYDDDETKPPALVRFLGLENGVFLAQLEAPRAARPDYPFECTLLKIEDGATFSLNEDSGRFSRLLEIKNAAKFLNNDRKVFPAIRILDKAKFLAALNEFAATADFDRKHPIFDADAMKRLHPGKQLPK